MARLTRTQAIKVMEACKFTTAAALSTHRLEKKINRLDRITIDRKKMSTEDEDLVNFVLEAIAANAKVEVQEDRPNIPQPVKQTKAGRPSPLQDPKKRKFDSGGSKYDWGKILSGNVVQLTQGEDFQCKPTTFALQVRAAAKRRDQKARIAIRGNTVVVQAIKEEGRLI